jgi:hypothetical protein
MAAMNLIFAMTLGRLTTVELTSDRGLVVFEDSH